MRIPCVGRVAPKGYAVEINNFPYRLERLVIPGIPEMGEDESSGERRNISWQ